ncbi:Peptidase family C54 [Nesidiocoris tenuis]|uniref:Cysteine protease n=1 Tax=Nesidiocoris tenuis TaxID=355587 RepID=A0ABN7AAR1_9HEMI|nr:Peptidase family C54 [Nesidiocoris tenuis]
MDMMFEAYSHETGFLGQSDSNRSREPHWILGKKHLPQNEEALKKDIASRLWFSYRKGFVQIGDSGLTSDKGWGCMLRCGQMLMAQALLYLHLGRDWAWTPAVRDPKYVRIVSMFEDRRSAPYSIHQIALMGAVEGKAVGDWFGPNTVAQALKKLSASDQWSNMAVHVSLDNIVIVNEIRRLCRSIHHSTRKWRPLLLIVPVRLGLNEINPVYVKGLQSVFMFRQSVGIIGGKPNHALYFIGSAGDEMIYLDPHTTQPFVPIGTKSTEQEKKADCSYHCTQARALPVLQMDPSVALGFFCATELDFDSLLENMREYLMKEQQPLLEVCEDRPATVTHTVANEGLDDDFVVV